MDNADTVGKSGDSILNFLNRDNWIQGAYGRDAQGNSCDPAMAIKFCLGGAICKHYRMVETPEIFQRLRHVIGTMVTTWNDKPGRTWEEVEALIREAGV